MSTNPGQKVAYLDFVDALGVELEQSEDVEPDAVAAASVLASSRLKVDPFDQDPVASSTKVDPNCPGVSSS